MRWQLPGSHLYNSAGRVSGQEAGGPGEGLTHPGHPDPTGAGSMESQGQEQLRATGNSPFLGWMEDVRGLYFLHQDLRPARLPWSRLPWQKMTHLPAPLLPSFFLPLSLSSFCLPSLLLSFPHSLIPSFIHSFICSPKWKIRLLSAQAVGSCQAGQREGTGAENNTFPSPLWTSRVVTKDSVHLSAVGNRSSQESGTWV